MKAASAVITVAANWVPAQCYLPGTVLPAEEQAELAQRYQYLLMQVESSGVFYGSVAIGSTVINILYYWRK